MASQRAIPSPAPATTWIAQDRRRIRLGLKCVYAPSDVTVATANHSDVTKKREEGADMRITEIFSLGRNDHGDNDRRWYDDSWRNRDYYNRDWRHNNWDDRGHDNRGNC